MQVAPVYNVPMSDELKTERVTIMMAPSELRVVDDWSFKARIRSRGEAIRQLIQLGLEAAESDRPEERQPTNQPMRQ